MNQTLASFLQVTQPLLEIMGSASEYYLIAFKNTTLNQITSYRHRVGMVPKSKLLPAPLVAISCNAINPLINLPNWHGLYHPFPVKWGMV